MAVAAPHDHALPRPHPVVAGRAVDVIALAPPREQVGSDRDGRLLDQPAARLPGVERRVRVELAARDRALDAWPRRLPVGEEAARLERLVARLVVHLLPARGGEEQDDGERRGQAARGTPAATPAGPARARGLRGDAVAIEARVDRGPGAAGVPRASWPPHLSGPPSAQLRTPPGHPARAGNGPSPGARSGGRGPRSTGRSGRASRARSAAR